MKKEKTFNGNAADSSILPDFQQVHTYIEGGRFPSLSLSPLLLHRTCTERQISKLFFATKTVSVSAALRAVSVPIVIVSSVSSPSSFFLLEVTFWRGDNALCYT